MSEQQLTPDQSAKSTYENEVICEKLLGWKKTPWFDGWAGNWTMPDDVVHAGTPSFTTWAEAGLILDWLQTGSIESKFHECCGGLADDLFCMKLTPASIRAAALAYARSLP